MGVTNNNVLALDLPLWEVLQPLPLASAAGISAVNDLRGTDRYIYLLISASSFWRYDVWTNTYQQLPSPPAGTLGAGTALVYDPSVGRVWALISNGVAAPTFQYYDVATHVWTARSVTNLPATFGTDSALCHPCTTYNVGGDDNSIYLIGNAATPWYKYSISGNSWAVQGTACPSATGAGCDLLWLPTWSTDRLLRIRGGGNVTIDWYSIATPAWTGITCLPAAPAFTTGTISTPRDVSANAEIFIQQDVTNRIYKLTLATLLLTPFVTQYLLTDGAAHVGDRLLYVKSADGIEFLYYGLHTSAQFVRTPFIPGV
jgi:hypothetical protein